MSTAAQAAAAAVSPPTARKPAARKPAAPKPSVVTDEDRIQKAYTVLLQIYAHLATPSAVLPKLLDFAAGATKEKSIKAFLKKYSKFDKDEIDPMPAEKSNDIRTHLLELIQQSKNFSPAEKKFGASQLVPSKWKGKGGRHLRLGRKWFHYCRMDRKYILQHHPEAVRKDMTNPNHWFYLAIKRRCDGVDSFYAMKEYDRMWKHATDYGKFVTLKQFVAQGRRKKRSAPKETGASADDRQLRSGKTKGSQDDDSEGSKSGDSKKKKRPAKLKTHKPTRDHPKKLEVECISQPLVVFGDEQNRSGTYKATRDTKGRWVGELASRELRHH
jgi:hypothetical protein